MKRHRSSTLVVLLGCPVSAFADVRLPALISDNMVLLQDAKANVWGWADPGESVKVALAGKSADTKTDAKGKWSVKLEGLAPGSGKEMTVAGKNTITIKNVAVGEVWAASGQSNMEFTVKNALEAGKEIAAGTFPDIRVFTVAKKGSMTPLDDCTGRWEPADPKTTGHFSAVGYFFCRELHQKLKQPVGLIHSSWGGTPVETWIPKSGMEMNPAFGDHWKKQQKADQQEKAAPRAADKSGSRPSPAPESPESLSGTPGALYNGMIAPVAPFTIRGAIWYQGEANGGPHKRGSLDLYAQLFPALILSWRHEFAREQGIPREDCEFPFLFVQLASYRQRHDEPTDSYWAQIREAQFGALEVPRTGMAVAIDIGDTNDIHPKNKQEVAHRLALSALAQVYFNENEFSGPLYAGMQIEEGKVRLTFSNSGGMKSRDAGPVRGFALAGEDRKFHWADASIEGDHVIVSSPKVPNPVAVRYGWADNPDCNLINSEGLPASPFRSDTWAQSPPPRSAGL